MGRVLVLGVGLWLVAACGESVTVCTHEGTSYTVGEGYPVDCNACVCQEDGTFACTRLACVDAGPVDAGPVDAGPVDAAPDAPTADAGADAAPVGDCPITSTSSLPGVEIVFPEDSRCVFSVAEAAAGIAIPYSVEATMAHADLTAEPLTGGGCGSLHDSGLDLFERLEGGDQLYCLCDVGLCPGEPAATAVAVGSYPASFAWMGRNWIGPSDFGNPMGEPFPPGTYTLTVRAAGERGAGAAYEVAATLELTLVP